MALPDHVIDVIDGDAIVLQSTEANAKKVEECLAATIKIGVSCSDYLFEIRNKRIQIWDYLNFMKTRKLQLNRSASDINRAFPDAIGNLSLLNTIYLNSNKLEDLIPSSLGNCTKLTVFSLADNRLSGKIPKQIIQLSSLSIGLDLSQNSLSGSIPLDIKDLKMLNILDLSYNNLSGTITSNLGECVSLTTLKLQGNQFQGIIPSSISSLRGLEVLDMSQNNLSGKIPQFLDKWVSLEFLNLSSNDFEGEVPVLGVFANASAFSVLGNNRLCGGLVTLKLPKCKEKGSKKTRRNAAVKHLNLQEMNGSGKFHTMSFSTANLIGEGGFDKRCKTRDIFKHAVVYPMYKAFIEPDLKTANMRIVNKLNPFTGFQSPTYILKGEAAENEGNDVPNGSRFSAVIEKIERLYMVCNMDLYQCRQSYLSSWVSKLGFFMVEFLLNVQFYKFRK
ncbi:kinase-like domain-containing protein [Tanacetum coccineum]